MTRVRYEPKLPALEFSGHAGAGVRGQDPVCAALSMLSMTLERRVTELAEHCFPAISRAPGRFQAVCRPEEDFAGQCRECFETVAAGLALLAEERPEHVRFRRQEDANEEDWEA